MRPILFEWRAIKVWSYPVMLYMGLNAGVVAGNIAAHAAHINPFRVFVATILLMIPALFGSRLLGAAANWRASGRRPRRFWAASEGGGQYGGLMLALPLSVPLLSALGLPLGAFWDVAMITMQVAMIFGRIGCWLHGCCAGRPTNGWLGVNSPNAHGVWQRRIPNPLLESAWSLVLLIFALLIWKRLPFPGALFLVISGSYALGRVFMESLRDRESASEKFTIHHGISVATVVLCLAVLAMNWRK